MANKDISYQEAMNNLHAPEGLVQKTLDAMKTELDVMDNAENTENNTDGSNKTDANRVIPFRRVAKYILAAAACIALFFDVRQFIPKGDEAVFGRIDTSALLSISTGVRGTAEEPDVKAIESILQLESESFVPGYTLINARASQIRATQLLSRLEAEYQNDSGETVFLEFTDYLPVLHDAMKEFKAVQYSDTSVRFAKDTVTGVLYAAWTKNGVYYTLSSQELTEGLFVDLTKQLTQKL